MNPIYLETYRRHRAALLLLPLVAVVTATWFTVAEPKTYQSTASLWADTPAGTSDELIGAAPPAEQEQATLTELLTTEYFRSGVARRGPLAAYLESNPAQGWGPTALLVKLRGSASLEDRVAAALGPKRVTTLVHGPHVLEIKYEAPTPQVAAGTLRALIETFRRERNIIQRDPLATYRNQIRAASRALEEAREALRSYLRDNPESTASPEVDALREAERTAAERLAAATVRLSEATGSALETTPADRTLRVIDAPNVPTAPTTGAKRVVLGVLAGLFAGIVVSLLGVVALARGRRFATGLAAAAAPADADPPSRAPAATTPRAIPGPRASRRTRSGT